MNFSIAEVAALFCVSERTVWRYIALFRQTGNIQPQLREHGPKKMLGDLEQLTLLHLILENHGIYLYEIQTKLESLFGARVSTPQDTTIDGLHPPGHAMRRHPAF